MKTSRFLSLAVFFAVFSVSSIFADTLYLKDGQEIKDAVVTEIGDSDVKYKISGRQVVYTAKKSSIAVIIYDDGTRETFGSNNSMNNAVQSQSKEVEARTRYGVRAALNSSYAAGVDFSVYLGHSYSTYETGVDGNVGFEAGWLISIPIFGSITFNSGLNFIYRSPINSTMEVCLGNSTYICTNLVDVKGTEFAISTPILFQGMPFGGPVFYTNGGIQIDFPFDSKIKVSYSDEAVSLDFVSFDRTPVDIGVVLGIGWFVGEHLAIDCKAVVGLTSFDGTGGLLQGALGLNYWL